MAGPPYNVLVQEIGGVVPKGRGEQISADEADQYDVAHLIAAGAIAGTGPDLPPQAAVGRTLTGVALFDPAAVYVPGQVATDGVRAYVCTARTTTPGTAPSADGAHWSQLAGVQTPFYATVTGSTQALDPSAHGGFHMDILHDVTLSLSANAVEGQLYTMALDGDPSVPRTVTFGTGFTALGATLVLAAGSTTRLLFVGHDHLLEEAQPSALPAPAGVPVLHGPYVVDYTDIPHDGDKMTLWTPQVGDCLVGLFADEATGVAWDQGAPRLSAPLGTRLSPDQRSDAFDRPDQIGWGTADGGAAWTLMRWSGETDSTASIVSSAGTLTTDGANGDTPIMLLGDPLAAQDAELLVRFALDATHTNSLIVAMHAASDYVVSGLRAQLRFKPDGHVGLGFTTDSDSEGYASTHSWLAGATYVSGDKWWLRFQGAAGTYRWRFWRDGTSEPTSWLDSYTVTLAPIAAAHRHVGVSADGDTTQVVAWISSFRAATLAPVARPAPSDYVFHTTDPVQIQLAQTGGTDPTAGYVELYALVARAVAP